MIIGIGTDIVNIESINKIFQKHGDKFLQKNFHELEIEQYNNLPFSLKLQYLAKRFAGKEAVSKALGTGIGQELNFKDIAIINNELGRPQVVIPHTISPTIADYNINISLSDDDPFAIAFVVITNVH